MSNPELAVGQALLAQIRDEGAWRELALVLDNEQAALDHPRLLRALRFGDDDYAACALQIVPALLGLTTRQLLLAELSETRAVHVEVLEEHLDLPQWLAEHEPRLH